MVWVVLGWRRERGEPTDQPTDRRIDGLRVGEEGEEGGEGCLKGWGGEVVRGGRGEDVGWRGGGFGNRRINGLGRRR